MPSAVIANLLANQLTVGEETIPRECISNSAVGTTSGFIRVSFFTARKTETTTQVRMISGATPAAATPTLVRIGLFEIAADSTATLVAATADDTSLFSASVTAYTRNWTAPYQKVAGRRYGLGALVVTATTPPQFIGQNIANGTEFGEAPVLSLVWTGLTDLPALGGTLAGGSGVPNGARPYAVVLP